MNINLNKDKKPSYKRYIINGVIIFIILFAGVDIGSSFNQVSNSDVEKVKIENTDSENTIKQNEEKLKSIKEEIESKTSKIEELKKELETEKQ